MRGRVYIILSLFAVLILLLVFLFLVDRGEVKVIQRENDPLFGKLESKYIDYIKIWYRDYYDRTVEYSYEMLKISNRWFVKYSNTVDRIETKLANFIVNILVDLESLQKIKTNEVEDYFNTFGFSKSNALILFSAKGQTNYFTVGDLTVPKDYYYVLKSGDLEKVHLVYAYKIDNILKYPHELRDKNIFTEDWTNSIISVNYESISKSKFTLVNDSGKWLLDGSNKELDSVFVEKNFLTELKSLRIEGFIDGYEKQKYISSTNRYLGKISLTDKLSNHIEIFVLETNTTRIVCFEPTRNSVFVLDYQANIHLFNKNIEQFYKLEVEK